MLLSSLNFRCRGGEYLESPFKFNPSRINCE